MTTTQKVPSKPELDKQLSSALEQTFPASDPVAVGQMTSTKADRPADRRAPRFDSKLINGLAEKLARRRARSGLVRGKV